MDERYKELFETKRLNIPALEKCTYLNAAGSGPTPLPVVEQITKEYQFIYKEGAITVPVLQTLRRKAEIAREKMADILNVTRNEITITRSVAESLNTILYCYNWNPGDEIILSNEENPAIILPLQSLARKKGVILKKINLQYDEESIIHDIREGITSKTRLICISHVTHVSGLQLPVKEICNLANENNILTFLDGAQSVGQIKVDVSKIDCDFYVVTGHKWLMGPDGTGWMYINKKHLNSITPAFVGVGSQLSFDYLNDTIEFKKDATKFEYGGRQWPLYIALGKAIDFVKELNIEKIQDRGRELSLELRNLLKRHSNIEVVSPEEPSISSGIFTFTAPNSDHVKLVEKLWEDYKILVQWRRLNLLNDSKGIRVSLAWFVQEEELEKMVYYTNKIINSRG